MGVETFEDDALGATTTTASWYSTLTQTSITTVDSANCVSGSRCIDTKANDVWHVDATTAAEVVQFTFYIDAAANLAMDLQVRDDESDTCTFVELNSNGSGGVVLQYVPTSGTRETLQTVSVGAFHTMALYGTGAVTLDGNTYTRTPFAVACNNIVKEIRFSHPSPSNTVYVDNILLGDSADFPAPAPPPGVSATVIDAGEGAPDNALIELRWRLSPDDPEQVQGEFGYSIFVDGTNVGYDSTTSADGDGIRFNLIDLTQTTPGPVAFAIKATNLTSGAQSVFSCTVSVDTGTLNDFNSCGQIIPGGPGGTDFTTPTDTGAGLLGFCSDLMGDSDASLFLCGLIFVVFAFMAMAGGYAAITRATGIGPTIAGSVAGFGMMVFNVFAGIWGIVWAIVLIVLVAAIITAVVKKFSGASGGAASGE